MALERLEFEFIGEPENGENDWGVSSYRACNVRGDLEILAERLPAQANVTRIHVTTSAVGFGSVWQMVIDEFMATHKCMDAKSG